jgi:hypothetical protein
MESKADPLGRLQRLTAWLAVLGLRYAPAQAILLADPSSDPRACKPPGVLVLIIVLELALVLALDF